MRLFMLILHFIGLAMGIGTGMGFMFLGMASSKMEQHEARKFNINALALGKMGTIGIILLILSGSYLVIPFLPVIAHYPFLIIKLSLVLLLVIVLIINHNLAKKARNSDSDVYLNKLKKLGPVSMTTAILIVIMAVLSFK
jgi:uncharacterized membrane protein